VLTEDYAKAEVERLNMMNASKGCQYVVQLTELDETHPRSSVGDLPDASASADDYDH
jgi:hypothetical protein